MKGINSLNKEELIKFVKGFPDRPGVYLMRDENGEIIYVGKAKSLRKRVSSYFRHTHASPRLNKLVETIRDISTMRTETEIEALILENRLIKLYQPFFNVDLKMNERYAYIKITAEKHPRIIVTRVKMDDGAVYIGPYVRVSEVRALLRLVERYLPLRSCGGAEAKPQNGRPCMKYSLGRCLAPCCGLCTENEYRDRVADVALLLQGHGAELVERLRKRMDKAARELKFEEAAHLRDTIRAIWRVSRQQNTIPEIPSGKDNFWEVLNSMQKTFHLPVLPWRIDGFDISHSAGNFTVGVAVVFEQGYPNPSLSSAARVCDAGAQRLRHTQHPDNFAREGVRGGLYAESEGAGAARPHRPRAAPFAARARRVAPLCDNVAQNAARQELHAQQDRGGARHRAREGGDADNEVRKRARD